MDTKSKTLFVVSAFIGEKGYKKGTSQLIDAQSPNATPKSGSVVVPNNSIPDSEENVNTSSQKNRNSLNTSDPLRYKSTTAELLSEATSYHFGYLPLRIRTDIVDRLHESQFERDEDMQKTAKDVADHSEMSIDIVKNLPHLLNEPMLILDSKTVSGRLVLLGEVYAENRRPVMMALELNPKTRSGNASYVDVIKVASAYTRSNTQNLINTSNIRYVNENKNRVNDWLKVNRLQLPLPNSQSDSADNSIPDSEENVNTSSQKNRNSLNTSDPLRYKSTTALHQSPRRILKPPPPPP